MSKRFSYDAIVVGAGPNGLAAAIRLAQHHLSVLVLEANSTVGGGARSAALTLDGFVHDVCSAIHPLAVGSPFLKELPLGNYGLSWIQPDIPLAHPLEGAKVAVLKRSLSETATDLGKDKRAYLQLLGPLTTHCELLSAEILQPILHWPKHPIALGRFAMRAVWPAATLARRVFDDEPARALLGGLCAHSCLALDQNASSAFGLMLGMAGHSVGWPLPRGGSQRLADALADYLRDLKGETKTGFPVDRLDQLPSSRAVFLDVAPSELLRLAGHNLPDSYRTRLQRFRRGPGIFKLDYALDGPIPWASHDCSQAGTVHVGGTFIEVATAEREVADGKHPEKPFVLVAQPSLFDSTRAPQGKHTAWAYCHVPNGSTFDMTERIERQIERFAPGFRDIILARHAMSCPELERRNRNLAGGDISGGANNLGQLLARPTLSAVPYRTPVPGLYLCSSSTPPGGGVHGMCGFHAAELALKERF
jgi:phytoene dehydrogenase-like protein